MKFIQMGIVPVIDNVIIYVWVSNSACPWL